VSSFSSKVSFEPRWRYHDSITSCKASMIVRKRFAAKLDRIYRRKTQHAPKNRLRPYAAARPRLVRGFGHKLDGTGRHPAYWPGPVRAAKTATASIPSVDALTVPDPSTLCDRRSISGRKRRTCELLRHSPLPLLQTSINTGQFFRGKLQLNSRDHNAHCLEEFISLPRLAQR
jgi:hypothetical protein